MAFGWHDAKHERTLREQGFGFDDAAAIFGGDVFEDRIPGAITLKSVWEPSAGRLAARLLPSTPIGSDPIDYLRTSR